LAQAILAQVVQREPLRRPYCHVALSPLLPPMAGVRGSSSKSKASIPARAMKVKKSIGKIRNPPAKHRAVLKKGPAAAISSGSPRGAASVKAEETPTGATIGIVEVNRAPVLTLWMAVVLERLGVPKAAALGAGKVIAARCAIAKGRALGLLSEPVAREAPLVGKNRTATAAAAEEITRVAGQSVRLVLTSGGLRAVDPAAKKTAAQAVVDPTKVEAYLRGAFGDQLGDVQAAMADAATACSKEDLRANAMRLYERFRPEWHGWGARGQMRLSAIRAVGGAR